MSVDSLAYEEIRLLAYEEIRLLAYLKWEQAGKPFGESDRFWQEAEKEVLVKFEDQIPRKVIETSKPYSVLYEEGETQLRLYRPRSRTIQISGHQKYINFPHILFGYSPYTTGTSSGGYLFGGFVLEDISLLNENELENVKVYRMPFPNHFDRGQFGPCCLDWDSNYYQPGRGFEECIKRFWCREFRGMWYASLSVEDWSALSTEDFEAILKKLPPQYNDEYCVFLTTVKSYVRT